MKHVFRDRRGCIFGCWRGEVGRIEERTYSQRQFRDGALGPMGWLIAGVERVDLAVEAFLFRHFVQ